MGTQDVTKHGGSAYNLEMAQNELYGPPESSYMHKGGVGGPAESTTAAPRAGTGAGTVV